MPAAQLGFAHLLPHLARLVNYPQDVPLRTLVSWYKVLLLASFLVEPLRPQRTYRRKITSRRRGRTRQEEPFLWLINKWLPSFPTL